MKIRNGFVSNSSSSSFTCSVCNSQFSGWDAGPHDFGHEECVKGHIFCNHKIVNKERFDKLVEKGETDTDELPDGYWKDPDRIEKYGLMGDDLYEIPSEFCPVCCMNIICNDDCIAYLYKKYSTNNKELADEIKKKFSSYDEFREYLKS